MIAHDVWRAFVPAFLTLAFVLPRQALAADSWLDRPIINWNREGSGLPRLPRPPADAGNLPTADRCREQIRQPASPGEKAVARTGWMIYGPVQTNGMTAIFLAMSAADGMCRPLGYQAFVYAEGRYAGTLSPTAMDSRSDGALTSVHLASPTSLVAEFARYSATDALCCPSGNSTVQYRIRYDEVPDLVATGVKTVATSHASERSSHSLFGRRWVLTEMGGQRISADKPFIEFDEKSRRAFGDSGCNHFSGGFEVSGTSLKFSPLVGTKRACVAEEANRLEVNFLRALENVTRFEAQEKVLRLFAGDNQTLIFAAK